MTWQQSIDAEVERRRLAAAEKERRRRASAETNPSNRLDRLFNLGPNSDDPRPGGRSDRRQEGGPGRERLRLGRELARDRESQLEADQVLRAKMASYEEAKGQAPPDHFHSDSSDDERGALPPPAPKPPESANTTMWNKLTKEAQEKKAARLKKAAAAAAARQREIDARRDAERQEQNQPGGGGFLDNRDLEDEYNKLVAPPSNPLGDNDSANIARLFTRLFENDTTNKYALGITLDEFLKAYPEVAAQWTKYDVIELIEDRQADGNYDVWYDDKAKLFKLWRQRGPG